MRDLVENLNFNDIENPKESIVLMKDNKTLSILVILNVVKTYGFHERTNKEPTILVILTL